MSADPEFDESCEHLANIIRRAENSLAALPGHTSVVEIPVGKRFHGLRFGSGSVLSLPEAARELAPHRLKVNGSLVRPAPNPASAVSWSSRPLFVPLKRQFFEAFERGEKTEEFRVYGPRWNEITCVIGRPVVLSLGYGKARRLSGRVVSFKRDRHPFVLPGWLECYGDKIGVAAACIGIEIARPPTSERTREASPTPASNAKTGAPRGALDPRAIFDAAS